MKIKLIVALCMYAVFAISAWFTLDGKLRYFIWILMGGFAIRTISGYFALKAQASDEGTSSSVERSDVSS